jgi:hypothetical protein
MGALGRLVLTRPPPRPPPAGARQPPHSPAPERCSRVIGALSAHAHGLPGWTRRNRLDAASSARSHAWCPTGAAVVEWRRCLVQAVLAGGVAGNDSRVPDRPPHVASEFSCRGSGSAAGLPLPAAGSEPSPALMDIIGARRVCTAVMIFSGSIPCRLAEGGRRAGRARAPEAPRPSQEARGPRRASTEHQALRPRPARGRHRDPHAGRRAAQSGPAGRDVSLLADAPDWYRPGSNAEPLQISTLGPSREALWSATGQRCSSGGAPTWCSTWTPADCSRSVLTSTVGTPSR